MRVSVHPAALLVAWLLASIVIGFNGDALAQAQQQTAPAQLASPKPPAVRQIALTEKQIKGFLAASDDIHTVTDNAPEDIDKLSPKTIAQLDAVARKNGLASYDEYNTVSENISLVFAGYDTVTRKYIGKEALIKARIARVQADKKMSADSRKEALRDLKDDLQSPLPWVEYKNNIDLVVKY
jgi:hypothetical protein